jgi:tetratricopeptide (TPR) repeat protein
MPNRFRRWVAWPLVLLLALTVVLAGCDSRTGEQIAADEVAAGLQAHQGGNLDEAARHYLEALRHDAQNKFAYYNLGLVHQTLGDPAAAEQSYRLALVVDPDFPPALFNLAIVRAGFGARDEAIELYTRVVMITPDNAGAHFNRGLLLREAGRQAEGDDAVRIALALDPSLVDPAASGPPASGSPAPSPAASPSSS